jgi:hypothetical protein
MNESSPETDKSLDYRDLFEMQALLGTAQFLQFLIPPEKAVQEYRYFNERNSRNFLLLQILVEVQKSGLAMRRWRKQDRQTAIDRPPETLSSLDRLLLASLVDEQSLWQRKLSEGLVLLINFSSTNDLQLFCHFLLLTEIFVQQTKVRDNERFFSKANLGQHHKLDRLIAECETVRKQIGDRSKCWYLDEGDKHHRKLASFSKQLERALTIATSFEKRALGYTYAKGFGDASGNIHLTALKPVYASLYDRFRVGFAICGVLMSSLLNRAHELANVLPTGINKGLVGNHLNDVGGDPTKGAAVVGDLVLVEGPLLGKVEEVTTGPYGYEVYRVRIVETPHGDAVALDWYSMFDITPFRKGADMVGDLKQMLSETQAEGNPVFDPPPSDAEMEAAMREAMTMIWNAGLGEHVKRTAKRHEDRPGFEPPATNAKTS